jgi:adenylyltransferase/sulfurtransferase
LESLNSGVNPIPQNQRSTAANVMALLAGYDIVADGSDNFATRFLLNDACFCKKRWCRRR